MCKPATSWASQTCALGEWLGAEGDQGLDSDELFHGAEAVVSASAVAMTCIRPMGRCPHVQSTLGAYLQDLCSLGVEGFRVDAAKHQEVTRAWYVTHGAGPFASRPM